MHVHMIFIVRTHSLPPKNMDLQDFLQSIGEEVDDAEEESFLLFSQDIPSANLGFIDSRSTTVDISILGEDYTVHQSPTLLSSSRSRGTTGAVVWKITPQFAEWISQPPIKNETETETKKQKQNPLWSHFILSSTSTIVELGCGISGLVGLALAPSVKHYLATDQEYVRKLFWENVYLNAEVAYKHHHPSQRSRGVSHGKKQRTKHKHDHDNRHHPTGIDANINISFTTLDWETDIPSLLKDTIGLGDNDNKDKGFDLLISCDCIYNEALTRPFLRTCAEICRLRPIYTPTDTDIDTNSRKSQPHRQTQKQSESESSANADVPLNPTICVIAQHLRSPEVFETWLREALEDFRVWRVRDEVLSDGLRGGTGNVVHLLALR